jgi:hypothetical protein
MILNTQIRGLVLNLIGTISLWAPVYAMANNDVVNVPELDRQVHYQQDATTN